MVLRRWTLVLKTNPNSFQGNLGKPRNPLPLTSQPQAEKRVANLLLIHIWLVLIFSDIVSERGSVGCRQTSHWLFFPFDKLPGLERFPFRFSELPPLFQLPAVFLLFCLWIPARRRNVSLKWPSRSQPARLGCCGWRWVRGGRRAERGWRWQPVELRTRERRLFAGVALVRLRPPRGIACRAPGCDAAWSETEEAGGFFRGYPVRGVQQRGQHVSSSLGTPILRVAAAVPCCSKAKAERAQWPAVSAHPVLIRSRLGPGRRHFIVQSRET